MSARRKPPPKGSPQTPSRRFGSARAKKLRRYIGLIINPKAGQHGSIYQAVRGQWRSSTTAERGKFAKRMKRQMAAARAAQEAEQPQ